MIQLTTLKAIKNNDNVVFLTDNLSEKHINLTKDELSYFKKSFAKQKIQFIKPQTYTFVVNTTKQSNQEIRVHAFEAHKILKNEEIVTVVGNNTEHLIAFIEGFLLSNYQFLKYFKNKEKKQNKIKKLQVVGSLTASVLKEIENVVTAVFWAKDMVNEPVSYLDSVRLAEEIKEKSVVAKNYKVEIFEQMKIQSLKMGGLLAVNQGSETPPTFTIMEYKPKNAINKKPYVLVGKGIVYDTGGLSLKPTANSMDFMKADMGGAACMAATIHAVALNNLPVHIVGLIPATDNRPGKNAYAPGDVVTMFDGTTVEVLNTDAEGRMVLADAIAYADKYNPELIIDAATLTGAAVRAIGVRAAVFMGNAKEKYFTEIEKAGQQMHDRVIRFPFWDEWKEDIKSDIADIKNLGGPYAGMITAGKFLEHFTKKNPYVHIDLSNAYLHAQENYKGKGATGAGVRLLYQFFKNMTKK